jgi:hypothetical protein
MRPDHLALISKNAQAVKFKTEDILFREGEPAWHLSPKKVKRPETV